MAGLGRLFKPDDRDEAYHIRTLLTPDKMEAGRDFRLWWPHGWWGNQGETSMCVEYAWQHWLADGPVSQIGSKERGTSGEPIIKPIGTLYHEAQKIDEWPGEDYEGTSVRAGAKVLQDRGYIGSYHWAWDLETVIDAVISLGPVVMGTNWYWNMFDAWKEPISVSGDLAGGHAWKIDAADRKSAIIRAKNSWGRDFGFHGFFYMSFEDLERLINEDGEACIATELYKTFDGVEELVKAIDE